MCWREGDVGFGPAGHPLDLPVFGMHRTCGIMGVLPMSIGTLGLFGHMYLYVFRYISYQWLPTYFCFGMSSITPRCSQTALTGLKVLKKTRQRQIRCLNKYCCGKANSFAPFGRLGPLPNREGLLDLFQGRNNQPNC